MKRFLLFVMVCAIGMVVPQIMMADVSINTSTSGKVVITSDNAGDLTTYLKNATTAQLNELKADEIVFVGKFNSTDLSTLSSKGCCVATSVNMAEAKFIKTSTTTTYLFHSDGERTNKAEGEMCIVGSVKKQSAEVRAWVHVDDESVIPSDQINNAAVYSELPSAVPNYDVYIRIPKTYNYYKVIEENYNRQYQKVNEDDIPEGATIHTPPSITEANKNDYLHSGGVNVGDYMRVSSTYDYYTNPVTLTWKNADSDYNNGDQLGENLWYASDSELEAPTSTGQTVYVGGTKYAFKNGSWSTDLSVEDEYDYSQMSFSNWGTNLKKAITSNHVPTDYVITKDAFGGCTQIQEVVFNSGIIGTNVIGQNFDENHPNVKVTIGSGVTEIAYQAFNKCPITDLDWSSATSLQIIGKEAFEECPFTNVSTLTIPSSVKTINEKAFFNICKPLTQAEVDAGKGVKTIIFPADTHLDEGEGIADHAFWLESTVANPLKDVYVNANKEIPCHKEAFSHWNTDGQTQVTQTGARTRLHYPTEFFDFYVGDYKSEINGGYLVGNPEMIKSRDSQYRINGWQKFISSGILMAPDVTWRSFSDDVPYYVPDVNEKGWRTEVYLVDGYDSSKGAKLVRMKIGDLIPANTGVIVHFEFDSTDGAVLYLPAALIEVTENGETKKIIDPAAKAVEPYDIEDKPAHLYTPTEKTGSYKNYLKKLNKTATTIENVEIVNGKKTYRNFFFCNNDELKKEENKLWRGDEWSEACLQGWGFLRAVHGVYTISNKAYLHFPAKEGFPGSESVGIQEDHSTDTNLAAVSSKQFGFITINEDGEEFNCMPEEFGIATNVRSIEATVNDDCFYNMQGMKIENPSKGIYIKNGKKYVIK